MSDNDLAALFEDELKHAYYTEQQLLDALGELESQSSNEQARQAFSEHRSETRTHVDRLEDVFEAIGESPEAKTDRAVEGLIEDHEEFVDRDPGQETLDRYNIAAGQKSEHYEIAVYGNLVPLADQLGMGEVADLLEQTLRDEQKALEELSRIGEEFDTERGASE